MWNDPSIYVYIGETGDHVIVDSVYCSCEGFMRRLLQGEPGCAHVFAVKRAEEAGTLREIDVGVEVVLRIVWEVLTGGFSKTLRVYLYRKSRGKED